MAAPPIQIDGYSPYCRRHLEHQTSIVDDLLFEIYDRWHDGRHDSFESDTFTECSSTSEVSHWRRNSIYSDTTHSGRLNHSVLETQSLNQLRRMVSEMQHRINSMSSRLVRQLKRRDRRFAKLQHNCDLVTAIVQAASQKRRIDTRMKFSLEPPPGESAFDQWKDAMKAVARLPMGIPDSFRRKVWLSLADNHIKELRVDWNKTMRFAFNERSNPDDNNLGMQIVKDLHRTGCSGFSGQDNDEDRAVLKRVLLGYARWNKAVGYCQGFNVIAALLLEVMDRKEDDALKVMIYLIDHVLPESYYANNLRALSVDMAVFRDLLRVTFPKLSRHLDYLQHAAQDQNTGACYEPPLTNVFTMQWFLTMFATCLPKDIVLRVWDSILLEGSEILLRTALAIWGKLSRKIQSLSSADEFYSLMGILTQDMMDGKIFDADSLIKFIYNCAPFPMQQLPELREKYTYNIRPFTSAASGNKKSTLLGNMLPSDEDDLDEEDLEAITCFTGIMPGQVGSGKNRDGEGNGSMADISMVGPGAYGMGSDSNIAAHASALSERMSTDISSLKKQYHRLKQRQNQAHIIIAAASAKRQARVKAIVPKIETPTAMNHLYVGKHSSQASLQNKNRYVTASPRMVYPKAITVPHFLQEGKKQASPSHKGKTQDMSPTEPDSPPKHKESPSKVVFNEQVDTCNEANTFCAVNEDTNNSNTSGNTDKEVEETEDKVDDVTCLVNKGSETERLCDEHEDIKVGVTPESKINRIENVEDLTEENSVHEITAKDTHEENRQDRNPILQIEGQQNEIQREDSEAVKILPIDIEEREKSDSEDSGIIDNSEFQNALDLGEDIEDEIYIRNACGRIEIPEERTDSEADIVKDSGREIGGDVVDGSENNDNHTCLFGDMNSEIDRSNNSHTTVNTLDSALSSKDIQLEETILHSEKEDGDSFKQSQMVEQEEILKQTRNIKSDSDIYCERAPEINPPLESQGTPLKSCLKSSRSIGNSGRSEGGNSRKMKLPKEKLITLTEYAKSKRKISSSSQESGSPKHFTDSDTGSVFSPDENNSSKSFTYTGQGERSVSFDSKMPSGLKPLTSKKPFNPFPVKHFNENRARTGIKLGIYKSSTFNELEKQSKRRPLWSK